MNRQAFKQRMQKYKAYKEQNPDARYLQLKEALPKNLQDDTSYNLRRAYELDYEPITVEGDTLKHLPMLKDDLLKLLLLTVLSLMTMLTILTK